MLRVARTQWLPRTLLLRSATARPEDGGKDKQVWAADELGLGAETPFGQFLAEHAASSALERGEAFEANDAFRAMHNATAAEGQSSQPSDQASVAAHFICFTVCDGILYELDGRKPGPIPLAVCAKDDVLTAAASAIQTYFMDPNPDELNFSMVAFSLRDPNSPAE